VHGSSLLSAPPTSHCCKRDPPLAETKIQQEHHYYPLLYVRVGSSTVVWELESSRASLGSPEKSSSGFGYYSCIIPL
jgi:hypothetical protein